MAFIRFFLFEFTTPEREDVSTGYQVLQGDGDETFEM